MLDLDSFPNFRKVYFFSLNRNVGWTLQWQGNYSFGPFRKVIPSFIFVSGVKGKYVEYYGLGLPGSPCSVGLHGKDFIFSFLPLCYQRTLGRVYICDWTRTFILLWTEESDPVSVTVPLQKLPSRGVDRRLSICIYKRNYY